VTNEARETAQWLKARLAKKIDGRVPSAAMLFRTRKSQGYFLDAMREANVPFHVLGIGGLMAEPEIADLVSALSVVDDPGAGLELVRLLAGSKWRLGVRDLHALNRLASWLRDRNYAQQPLDDEVRAALRTSVATGEGGSIVDALDFIATARADHGMLDRFTTAGLERLRDAGRTFAKLRSRLGLDLRDFVVFVMQELQLDIEVAANEYRPLGSANFDAFFDALGGYLAIEGGSSGGPGGGAALGAATQGAATLSGFLSWLREAELREDLTPRPEDPEPGTVQVLTIHGAKGLEWDLVVVPRLVEDELPGRPREGFTGWLSFGTLPWPFRGDAADLPRFEWEAATTRKEVDDAQKAFAEAVRARSVDEERRLFYVAVTRARHWLLLAGSFWATQVKPRQPSVFLRELADARIIPPLPLAPTESSNPNGDDAELMVWPLDPLGDRRASVEDAAARVLDAEPALVGPWQDEVRLLVEERRAHLATRVRVPLPTRVPASRFKDFVTEPAEVAALLRRPMPQRPYRATQLGTLFHAWVEGRNGVGGTAFELDAPITEHDGDEFSAVDLEALDRLKATFEASPWADRKPVEVEREIHLVLDGQIIICKLDAVYASVAADGTTNYQVVDWKTGKAPRDAQDLEEKQFQLALYRLAYSQWKGIDPSLIDAVFYYVTENRVIAPERLFSEDELIARWHDALR
jgi:DNA helicase-2/ATP-dependent DNA helicase PcrA